MGEFESRVSRGLIQGKRNVNVFSFSENVTTVKEDLWQGKILTPPVPNMIHLDNEENILIKSTDANDSIAGSGARTVFIEGVDQDYNRISETVNLNGISGVVTQNKYIGVNDLICMSNAVLGESNKGIITAEGNVSNRIQSVINIDQGQTHGSHYFIPQNEEALLKRIHITGEKNAEYQLNIDIVPSVIDGISSKTSSVPTIFFESFVKIDFEIPPLLQPSSRISVKAISDQGLANSISGSYDLELIEKGVF